METEHKQAFIYNNGVQIFTVDELLQELIQCFFDNDIYTMNSCQNDVGGNVWIEFYLYDWIELNERAYKQFRTNNYELHYFVQEGCDVKLHANDTGHLDVGKDEWIEGEDLMWGASVRFPCEMLLKFEALIREVIGHNDSAT